MKRIMKEIEEIQEEHIIMRESLNEIEMLIARERYEEMSLLKERLLAFAALWEKHEKKEEVFFNELKSINPAFANEMMFLNQHRQLRGHWKVIKDAINRSREDTLNFWITLETDGKMMFDKFRQHINAEDDFLNNLGRPMMIPA